MARNSAPDLEKVIGTDLETEQIQAFLDDASRWVTVHLSADTTFAATDLALIEKYLAAHFLTARDPRLTQGKWDDVSESFQRHKEVSEYLRIAIGFDPTGKVEGAFGPPSSKSRVRFRFGDGYIDDVVGTVNSE